MNLIGVKVTGDILTAAEVNAISQMITAPTTPTIVYSSGQTGTLTLSAAALRSRTSDSAAYVLEYNWTPAATTIVFTTFSVVAPAGWTAQITSVGTSTAASDGLPRASSLSTATAVTVQNLSTSVQRVVVGVVIVKD